MGKEKEIMGIPEYTEKQTALCSQTTPQRESQTGNMLSRLECSISELSGQLDSLETRLRPISFIRPKCEEAESNKAREPLCELAEFIKRQEERIIMLIGKVSEMTHSVEI